MDQISPEMIREIHEALQEQLSSGVTSELSVPGGVDIVAEMLNRVEQSTEKGIMSGLERENPELAEDVKKLMFVFEDIISLDKQSIRTLLQNIDNKELALSLKGASEPLKNKFLENMSERAATMIKEDMEFMGPVRLRNVEEAQQNILDIVRNLEDEGKIIVNKGGEEDQLIE